MADERTKLSVESPDMLRDNGKDFSVEFPAVLSEKSFQLMRWNIEFRRRCMNQGFDNLLELLDKHWTEVMGKHTPAPPPGREG